MSQTQRGPAVGPERQPAVGATGASTLACPECGTLTTVTLSRRDADDFCPSCDYPMFWARPQQAVVGPGLDGDDARRRSPGASGSVHLATVPCPACHELNLPGAWICVRCGGSMIVPLPPEPEPLPVPEPVVEPQPIREPQPAERFPLWWFAAMVGVGTLWWALSTYL